MSLNYTVKNVLNKKKNIDDYGGDQIKIIGCGGYGKVESRNNVAVKNIIMSTEQHYKYTLREISILMNLNHINIIKILDVFLINDSFNIVMEKGIQTLNSIKDDLDIKSIKLYSYQLLRAVAYCHSNGIVHRDIKPVNILIYGNNLLKLIDFGTGIAGLPTNIEEKNNLSLYPLNELGTGRIDQWSPERLLGQNRYTYKDDTWQCGILIAELLNYRMIFTEIGYSEVDQLFGIFRELGIPNEEIWPDVNSLPYFEQYISYIKFKNEEILSSKYIRDRPIPNVYINSATSINILNYRQILNQTLANKPFNVPLILDLLTLDPNKRIDLINALNSNFFDDVRIYIENIFKAPIIYQSKCNEILLLRNEMVNISQTIENRTKRKNLLKWIYFTSTSNKFSNRTFYLAVYLFDKYINIKSPVNLYLPLNKDDKWGIIAMNIGLSSLFIASMYQEPQTNSNKPLDDILSVFSTSMSYEFLTKDQILIMANDILKSINYDLMISLPYDFILSYSKQMKTVENIYNRYLENLLKIILSPQLTQIIGNNLAISTILSTHILLKIQLTNPCFIINEYHQQLASSIINNGILK